MNVRFLKKYITFKRFLWFLWAGVIFFGIFIALRSPYFIVKKVEFSTLNQPESLLILNQAHFLPPASELLRLTMIQVEKDHLLRLSFARIAKNLLSEKWISWVKVQRKFPDTVVIEILWKEPRAILQINRERFVYVDALGHQLGPAHFYRGMDFPILARFSEDNPVLLQDALRLIIDWEMASLARLVWIDSVIWDRWLGYRVLMSYPIQGVRQQRVRVMVDFGFENLTQKVFRVRTVIGYLIAESLAVRHISADAGKKVVVKTLSGP